MTNQRIPAIDATRAICLLGIFLMNIEFFYTPLLGQGILVSPGEGFGLAFLIQTLVHGKFWTMFSLLFGAGMVWASHNATPSKQLIRLLVLFIIGGLHCLLWAGDILTSYALSGVFVLALLWRKTSYILGLVGVLFIGTVALSHPQPIWLLLGAVFYFLSQVSAPSPKFYLFTGLGLWAVTPLVVVMGMAFLPVEQQQGLFNDYQSSFRLEENVLSSPAFSDNLHSNFLIWQDKVFFSPLLTTMIAGCMLIGVFLVKSDFFHKEKISTLIRHLYWAIPLTIFSLWMAPILSQDNVASFYIYSSLFDVAQLGQALGYIGLCLYVFNRFSAPPILSQAGKASLSIYVTQSLVGVFLFQVLFVQTTYPQSLLLALIVWLVLIVMFYWWMKKYPPPLETVWRKAVNLLMQGKS